MQKDEGGSYRAHIISAPMSFQAKDIAVEELPSLNNDATDRDRMFLPAACALPSWRPANHAAGADGSTSQHFFWVEVENDLISIRVEAKACPKDHKSRKHLKTGAQVQEWQDAFCLAPLSAFVLCALAARPKTRSFFEQLIFKMTSQALDFSSVKIGDLIKENIHVDWRRERNTTLDRDGMETLLRILLTRDRSAKLTDFYRRLVDLAINLLP